MKILAKLLKRPVTISIILMLLIALGIYSTISMPVNLLPDIKIPMLGVTIVYPGASATTVDEEVTDSLEEGLETIANLSDIKTYSLDNASVAILSFEYETNLEKKENEILAKIKELSLPSTCYEPKITTVDFNASAVATISVSRLDQSSEKLQEDVATLSNLLQGLDGVETVSSSGLPVKTIQVSPISGLEIGTLLFVQALSTNSYNIPLGSIMDDGSTVSIRNVSDATSIEELKDLPVSMELSSTMINEIQFLQKVIHFFNTATKEDLDNVGSKLNLASEGINFFEQNDAEELQKLWNNLSPSIKNISNQAKSYSEEEWNPTTFSEDYLTPLLTTVLGKKVEVPDQVATYFRYTPFSEMEHLASLVISFRAQLPNEITASDYEKLIATLNSANLTSLTLFLNEDTLSFIRNFSLDAWNDATMVCLLEDNDLSDDELSLLFSDLGFGQVGGIKLSSEMIHFVRVIDVSSMSSLNSSQSIIMRLGNVASIKEISTYSSYSYTNGEPSILISVYSKAGGNTSKIVKNVKACLKNTPLTSDLMLIDDEASFIDSSISNVLTSILIGGVLAIIVIYLFLRKVRTSLVISITMPLSVLCTLVCMYLMGLTLNMVSLGGLAVGIGMLVDNSIVVIESITCHQDQKESVFDSCIHGVQDVFKSLFASTLTTICVFFPILFTKGLTKEIFSDLSWAVIISLSFSILIAVTIIPSLYYFFHKKDEQKISNQINVESSSNETKKSKHSFAHFESFYQRMLEKSLKHKLLVILCSLVVFLGSILLVFTTSQEFLPSIDTGLIEIKLDYSTSTLEEAKTKTLAISQKMEEELTSSKIEDMSINIGVQGLLDTSISSVIRVQLTKKAGNTNDYVEKLRQIIKNDNQIGSVTNVDGVVASLTSGMSNLNISIVGDDPEVLKEIAQEIETKLENEKNFTRVSDNLKAKTKEMDIKVDPYLCQTLGINYENLIRTLRVGLSGYTTGTLKINQSALDINIKFNDDVIQNQSDLENFVVGYSEDKTIYLKDVATFTLEEKTSQILKDGKKYLVQIDAETEGIDTGSASKQMKKVAKEVLKNYPAYQQMESGVSSYLTTAFKGLVVALIISFVLLFAIMACQFESCGKSLIVMASIPLSFTGGFLALAATQVSLNVVSFIGIIMLMGVIVNNAIIMIDKIQQNCDQGLSKYDAVIEGCRGRLRPILMTTLTTVLALLPLSLAIGDGSALMQPMGIVVMGGLTLGTFVTLFLIPSIYCSVKKIKK